MNSLDKQYQDLLFQVLEKGVKKQDRTGTGTRSVFGRQIRHKMSEGFPLLTTKKMAWKTMVTELLWFLRGDTNIKFLVDNGCHIWDGDAIKNYEKHNGDIDWGPFVTKEEAFIEMIKTNDEFAEKWGELGPIYGKQWRDWGGRYETNYILKTKTKRVPGIDQITNLIDELKNNPDSRRLMVSSWNVGELDEMVLPPCHYGFQVYTKELSYKERYEIWFKNNYETGFEYDNTKLINFDDDYWVPTPKRSLSLMWNQRSVDLFLGLPFNIASYGLLLLIISNQVGMIPDELIGNLGDVHLYENHLTQTREQLKREPFQLPQVAMVTNPDLKFDGLVYDNFKLLNYQSHPTIKAPLSN